MSTKTKNSKTMCKREPISPKKTSNRSSPLQSPAPGSEDSFSNFPDNISGSFENLDNVDGDLTNFNQGEDNINVVVRVRPLNQKEKKGNDPFTVQFPGNGQILVNNVTSGPRGDQKPKQFVYNVVFQPTASQDDILQFSGMKRLIEMALDGFRCTCFCYGQTGSGKTHTLTGPPVIGLKPSPFSDKHGLIFRSFLYLFQLIQEKPDHHFMLKASYLEIYNEKVIDLLNPGGAFKPLAVRWSKKIQGFFVENLFTVDCEELDDLIAVLEEGLRNRAVGKHNMNDFSSRSHTILTVYITCEEPAENGVFISRSGKINFVDLAGSEMTKKTQSRGKTLEEANNINKSLMVLGYCIASLSDKKKVTHIPYRDSKLTKLLADSLNGNGVTLMIACISPAKSNISETLNTLRYAARAKRIRTKPIVLMDPRESLIINLKEKVNTLLKENEYLRSVLHYFQSNENDSDKLPVALEDLEKISELDNNQLVHLVKMYMSENESLRKENTELFFTREQLQRDHEVVCRQNERLLKKLESITSPLVASRPVYSADNIPDINVWTSDDEQKQPASERNSSKLTTKVIEKELEKRQIGYRNNNTRIRTNRRNNTWDGKALGTTKVVKREVSSGKFSDRRPSMPTNKSQSCDNIVKTSGVFGSVINLTDETIY